MYIPKSFHTYYAMEAILHYLETGRRYALPDADIPDVLRKPNACFVSIYENGNRLRGCMGTMYPRHRSLFHEILDNAYFAAFEDKRFAEVMIEEMEALSFKVETLMPPEPVRDLALLDPDRFGVIVRSPQQQEGVLLPGTDGVHTAEDQLNLAMKKGGIPESSRGDLDIFRFEVNVFE